MTRAAWRTPSRPCGLPVIPQLCTADADEVAAWLEREGLTGADLVVKPPKSASTDGVIKLAGGADWRGVFTRQLGRVNQFGEIDDRLLVQKFVTGTEYVIDTFSHEGKHALVDVCAYRKIDNGPHMAVYDTMRWLPRTIRPFPNWRNTSSGSWTPWGCASARPMSR